MLDELFSCNPLFESFRPVDLIGCGKVTFTNFSEKGDGNVLPLPWNSTYQAAWKTFLQALGKKYNDRTALVAIAVAGPTAASAEMILPNDNNPSNPNTPNQMQFVPYGGTVISPNQMWTDLLQFSYADPVFLGTDQAFIDSWEQAIDTYQGIFSGLTLVVTTGNGLPNLSTTGPFTPPTTPINFANDCASNPNMDCQAETTILEYFAEPVGPNAKATQTSGLEASHEGGGDLGIVGVRFLSQQTATISNPPSTSQVLGGAQVNQPVSRQPGEQASPGTSPKAINQALYNAVQDFFTDTDAAPKYCEPSPMLPAPPLNYLQIYYQDFVYAATTGTEGNTSVNTAWYFS
jgi:hypothetical protein